MGELKFAIWRHENALGNSAEHTVGLSKFLHLNPDVKPKIYVENEFQKYFALCIKNVKEQDIKLIPKEIFNNINIRNVGTILKNNFFSLDEYKDVHMPEPYAYNGLKYPAMWSDLNYTPESSLEFPHETYQNKHNLPKDAIVIQFREKGTFDKRIDGANSENERFVNIDTFFKISLYYANLGYKIIRIGDSNQKPLPIHENIIDFAHYENKNMMDDLYCLSTCKVFVSTDSGIWPMAAGLKKNMVLTNMTSCKNKMDIVNWLPKETTKILFKKNWVDDNTFEEITEQINAFL